MMTMKYVEEMIARYGEPVLELAGGSGRFTMPLARKAVNITGMGHSDAILDLAKLKASKNGVNMRFLQGDVRKFDLGEKFKFIFIPAQSLSHLHT